MNPPTPQLSVKISSGGEPASKDAKEGLSPPTPPQKPILSEAPPQKTEVEKSTEEKLVQGTVEKAVSTTVEASKSPQTPAEKPKLSYASIVSYSSTFICILQLKYFVCSTRCQLQALDLVSELPPLLLQPLKLGFQLLWLRLRRGQPLLLRCQQLKQGTRVKKFRSLPQ